MKILAIGAHPDDIEYGCGGALLKYAKKGHEIYLMVLTDGRMSGDPAVRKKEQDAAGKQLNVKEIIYGNYEDTRLPIDREIIAFIENAVKRIKPDEVYVNYYEDTHQDHKTVAQCVISATRYVKKVLFYEDYTSVGFEPDMFIDIKDVLDEKIMLLNQHHSQIDRDYPTELDMLESVKAIANFRGFQGKIKYAEGFKSLRYLKDINGL
ncbi:MAG: PIG-L family deacetylase [Candidatus Omnitrophica bacterium]|nr:PIG-L family deacetylase [Candidatus Omnitrophota bacterium]